MPAIVRPSRIRHLDTLKSVSRALYNMDAALAEAMELECERQINDARAEMQAEKLKAQRDFFSRKPPYGLRIAGRDY
jgi:hypothetical protein